MIVTAKILQGEGKKLVVLPDKDISRYLAQKRPSRVEIRLNDGRTISADQRKKIFAIIRDIAIWSGDDPESIRQLLTWDFCGRSGREWFSLSDTDMTTAKSFINYLIEFCLYEQLLNVEYSIVIFESNHAKSMVTKSMFAK